MVGLVNRRWVRIVMSLDNSANFVGFVIHDGEMERISNGSIDTGDFIVVLWVVEDLCFSIGFSRDISGRMGRIGGIPEEAGTSNTTEVVLPEKGM